MAFATLGPDGRIRGLHTRVRYPSASIVKAMLLVATLRRAGRHPLTALQRTLLRPMITVSDNLAAEAVFGTIGPGGLNAVARAAHMRSFSVLPGALFEAQVTAADQVRFFYRIDRLVPRRQRAYARSLLSSVVSWQAWGIAPVARARLFRVFFKGGWRPGITHQAALLERDGRRMALAVLTRSPRLDYGEASIAGVAARVLSR